MWILPGGHHDLIKDFIDDAYGAFPVAKHGDMFDALARLVEPSLTLACPDAVKHQIRTKIIRSRENR